MTAPVHLRHPDRGQLLKQTRRRLAELWTPSRGSRYVIKPNLCAAAPADLGATTDPELVEALILHIQDHGAKACVVELPPHIRDVEQVFAVTGYRALCQRLGVDLVDPERQGGFVDAGPMLGRLRCQVARAAIESDGVVNVPKIKSHVRAHFTCAVKNLMGLTDMPTRHAMHVLGIHRGVADLYRCLGQRVVFNVVDAVVAMEGDGPTRGEPLRLDSVFMGPDALACDLYLARALGVDLLAARYLAMLVRDGAQVPPAPEPLLDRPLRPATDPRPNLTYLREALITQPTLRRVFQRVGFDRWRIRP